MTTAKTHLRVLALGVGLALPAPATAATLVSYGRSGGIAGESTTLVVQKDRHAARTTNRTPTPHKWQLGKKRYAALRSALIAAKFSTLASNYQPQYPVSDGITESVTFRGHSVTVSTGAEYPKRLDRALAKLRELA